MRISALCDETAAVGLSTPLGSLQSTLPDSQGSQPGDGLEDLGHIGQLSDICLNQNVSFDKGNLIWKMYGIYDNSIFENLL